MLAALLRYAMTSPARQSAFRHVAGGHVVCTALIGLLALRQLEIASQIILVLGIVEGASLIGWRLTQLPKSAALELLFVTSTPPRQVFLAEFLAGVGRFLLVQLAGFPILMALVFAQSIEWPDVATLMVVPVTWGILAGVGLTAWVYEPPTVRRIGELFAMLGVLVYLVVGVLAAENLQLWLMHLPEPLGQWAYDSIILLHTMNPFGVMRYWFATDRVAYLALDRTTTLTLITLVAMLLLSLRAASRFVGHFHDRHYRPIDSSRAEQSSRIGDTPLTWWAVRRVMEYSGRVNLYLAGGFGLAYAAYIVAGDAWPSYIGRGAFVLFDNWGGPAMMATAMAIMACVPAAYQYGLWDANDGDRARRLELLLLTELTTFDYAHAAASAAFRRGYGYALVALMLAVACTLANHITIPDLLAAVVGMIVLWALAFALGFRGFTAGHASNSAASLFVLGTPTLLYLLWSNGLPTFLAPPALVFLPLKTGVTWDWAASVVMFGIIATSILRSSLRQGDARLRLWYANHRTSAA